MTSLKITHKAADDIYIEDYIRTYKWSFYIKESADIQPNQVFEIDKITKGFSSSEGRSIHLSEIRVLIEDHEYRNERPFLLYQREYSLLGSRNEIDTIQIHIYEGDKKSLRVDAGAFEADSGKKTAYMNLSITLPTDIFDKVYSSSIPKNHSMYLTIKDFISPTNGLFGSSHMPDRFSPYVKIFTYDSAKYFSEADYAELRAIVKAEETNFEFDFYVEENQDLVEAEIEDAKYEQEKKQNEQNKSIFWVVLIVVSILGLILF
jgi:hypothetical protein